MNLYLEEISLYLQRFYSSNAEEAFFQIEVYGNNTQREFDQERLDLFKAYQVVHECRKSIQVLETTKGISLHNECNRLLLLNQFAMVFFTISGQQLDESDLLTQLAISKYLYLGSIKEDDRQYQQSTEEMVSFLHYLNQINNGKRPKYQTKNRGFYIINQIEHLIQTRIQDPKDFKAQYIKRFRSQAYHCFFQEHSCKYYLNRLLIEMDLLSMVRILTLPVDQFNEYYLICIKTLKYILFNKPSRLQQQTIIQNPDSRAYKSHFQQKQSIFQIQQQLGQKLLINSIKNGLTKAIVNDKIKCNKPDPHKQYSNQQLAGFHDALLIIRRLSKIDSLDIVDDLIYDTLIYKLG